MLKQQIERAIDENQIEQNTLSQEIENLEKDLVSEDSLDKKKQYNQQKLELHEKRICITNLKILLILIKKKTKAKLVA